MNSPEIRDWNWLEVVFKKCRLPYPFISLFIAVSFILYNYYFSKYIVGYSYWGFEEILIIASISILIFLELSGVQYFLNAAREAFKKLEISKEPNSTCSISKKMYEVFSDKRRYYIIAFLVIIPFIVIDPIRGTYYLWSLEYGINIITILFDILNYITTFLIFSSIATFFWIMLNISFLISTIENPCFMNKAQFNIYCEGTLIGLSSIRDLILQITVFNSICITMLLFSYITPDEIFNIEIILVIILASFGLYLFIQGWYVLNKIVSNIKYNQLAIIDDIYIQQRKRIDEIIIKETAHDDGKLNDIMKTLEFLKAEREQINSSFKNVYDLRTIITFLGAQILPFASKYQYIFIEKIKGEMMNLTLSIMN